MALHSLLMIAIIWRSSNRANSSVHSVNASFTSWTYIFKFAAPIHVCRQPLLQTHSNHGWQRKTQARLHSDFVDVCPMCRLLNIQLIPPFSACFSCYDTVRRSLIHDSCLILQYGFLYSGCWRLRFLSRCIMLFQKWLNNK